MGTMIHDDQTTTTRSTRLDRSELDDLLDEILGDQVFQTDFSRLCIADDRGGSGSTERTNTQSNAACHDGKLNVSQGAAWEESGEGVIRGQDNSVVTNRNQWTTANEFGGSSGRNCFIVVSPLSTAFFSEAGIGWWTINHFWKDGLLACQPPADRPPRFSAPETLWKNNFS